MPTNEEIARGYIIDHYNASIDTTLKEYIVDAWSADTTENNLSFTVCLGLLMDAISNDNVTEIISQVTNCLLSINTRMNINVRNQPTVAIVRHTHVVADRSDFPATMPPYAHQHVVADISDFPYKQDNDTKYVFYGSFNYAELPIGAPSGSFYIDLLTNYILFSYTDNQSINNKLLRREWGTQHNNISVKDTSTNKLNRYLITSYDENDDNSYTVFHYTEISNNFTLNQTYPLSEHEVNFYEYKVNYAPQIKNTPVLNRYKWTYDGTFTSGIYPEFADSVFYHDATNNKLLIAKSDGTTIHASLLASLEFASEIIVKIDDTMRNRYCIHSIVYTADNAVEYQYQTDAKLTVEEGTLIQGTEYELDFNPVTVNELDRLLGVTITNETDGDYLTYDSIEGWINRPQLLKIVHLYLSQSSLNCI